MKIPRDLHSSIRDADRVVTHGNLLLSQLFSETSGT